MAYRLSLPAQLQLLLHPTFHVSQLKLCHEFPATITHPPIIKLSNPYYPQPEKIVDRRMIQKGNKAMAHVLVKWKELPSELAIWED